MNDAPSSSIILKIKNKSKNMTNTQNAAISGSFGIFMRSWGPSIERV